MIIFRYLIKEVLLSVFSVTLVVLLVVMSGRFISYLQEAADGRISAEVLLPLIGYRIPGLLELILPLGLLLGILLAYGRLYMDNEMTVLHACGLSPNRLQGYTLIGGLGVAAVVAMLSLWVSPWANSQIDQIRQTQKELSEFDTVKEGRFQNAEGGNVSYVARLNAERTQLEHVFMATRSTNSGGREQIRVVNAATGEQYFDPNSGDRFVLLKDGYEYTGLPGQADYRKTQFEQYAFRIDDNPAPFQISKLASIPTLALVGSSRLDYQAQLHWRLSVPFLCLLLVILGVSLCKVSARQGRYGKILPSILLYIAYLTALTSARAAIEKGDVDTVALLWLIHLMFGALALSFHFYPRFWSGFFNQGAKVFTRLKPKGKTA